MVSLTTGDNTMIDSILANLKVHTLPIQLDLIDQIICIIPTGVRNITTILLIFMKINLQTIFYEWVKT